MFISQKWSYLHVYLSEVILPACLPVYVAVVQVPAWKGGAGEGRTLINALHVPDARLTATVSEEYATFGPHYKTFHSGTQTSHKTCHIGALTNHKTFCAGTLISHKTFHAGTLTSHKTFHAGTLTSHKTFHAGTLTSHKTFHAGTLTPFSSQGEQCSDTVFFSSSTSQALNKTNDDDVHGVVDYP